MRFVDTLEELPSSEQHKEATLDAVKVKNNPCTYLRSYFFLFSNYIRELTYSITLNLATDKKTNQSGKRQWVEFLIDFS